MTAAEFPDYRLVDADGQPLPRVFGHEQEYGFNFAAREHAEDSQFTHRLLLWMDMDLPQFTGDGARQYIDHDHPEYSTAEETSFLDGAYRYLHGHIATINRYRDYVRGRGPRVIDHDLHPDFIRLFANTCNQTTSWGKHKSLQVTRPTCSSLHKATRGLSRQSDRLVRSGLCRHRRSGTL